MRHLGKPGEQSCVGKEACVASHRESNGGGDDATAASLSALPIKGEKSRAQSSQPPSHCQLAKNTATEVKGASCRLSPRELYTRNDEREHMRRGTYAHRRMRYANYGLSPSPPIADHSTAATHSAQRASQARYSSDGSSNNEGLERESV